MPDLRIVRLFDTDIELHASWLLLAGLISLSLLAQFQQAFPVWSSLTVLLAAGMATFLFFVSLILHELAHVLVGRFHGLSTRSITLFMFGAVANMEKGASEPRVEFWVSIAGPLTSAVIGFLCLGVGWIDWGRIVLLEAPMAILKWLGSVNVALAVFNMIPAFPMDGGRVLRAILWWQMGDNRRSYAWAVLIGRTFAVIFMVWGALWFFGGGPARINGLWMMVIGWFLFKSAPLNMPKSEEKGEPSEKISK